jgi:hypothetical protein
MSLVLLILEWTNAAGIVTPAEAGVQERRERAWIPAFAGMTTFYEIVKLDGFVKSQKQTVS